MGSAYSRRLGQYQRLALGRTTVDERHGHVTGVRVRMSGSAGRCSPHFKVATRRWPRVMLDGVAVSHRVVNVVFHVVVQPCALLFLSLSLSLSLIDALFDVMVALQVSWRDGDGASARAAVHKRRWTSDEAGCQAQDRTMTSPA